jgi:UDP-N-acetyl-2-amino-2-deoxyglucuronate dehydrogenase
MGYRNNSKLIVDRKIRVGLVGCGRIAENHFNAISNYQDDLELVAVCDNNKIKLDNAIKKLGIAGYADLADMLVGEKLDLIVLTTPSGLHSSQAIDAAKAKCHVVTEKPMATTWAAGKKMVQACDENGVRLFVVKQNRHNETLQLLKDAVVKKRFGRIYLATINVFWTRPQSYYDADSWRGTWEFDGGAFMNQASHYVDLLDWLMGPVESIQAYTSTLGRNIEVEDTGVASVRWRSGAMGSINVTMLTYPKNLEGSITIIGENGTARIGGVAVNQIQHWDFKEALDYDEGIKSVNYETNSVYGFGHVLYYKNVIDVLRGVSEPYTDGREGLRSLELLVALYRAARDGNRVALPLDY